MNRQRRAMLNKALDCLDSLKSSNDHQMMLEQIHNAYVIVDECADDEDMALNNKPESFQLSAMNDDMQSNVDDLSDAAGILEAIEDEADDQLNYETIKSDIIEAVNLIKKCILR